MSEQNIIIVVNDNGTMKYLSQVYPTGGTYGLSKDSKRAMTVTEGEAYNGWVVETIEQLTKDGLTDIKLERI